MFSLPVFPFVSRSVLGRLLVTRPSISFHICWRSSSESTFCVGSVNRFSILSICFLFQLESLKYTKDWFADDCNPRSLRFRMRNNAGATLLDMTERLGGAKNRKEVPFTKVIRVMRISRCALCALSVLGFGPAPKFFQRTATSWVTLSCARVEHHEYQSFMLTSCRMRVTHLLSQKKLTRKFQHDDEWEEGTMEEVQSFNQPGN